MFLLEVMLKAMLIAFLRTPTSALLKRLVWLQGKLESLRLVMIRSSRTCSYFERRVYSRSNTISLTLLSDSLMTRVMKQDAADLIDAGSWVRVVRVVAACEGVK
jgi:hypothetical protein